MSFSIHWSLLSPYFSSLFIHKTKDFSLSLSLCTFDLNRSFHAHQFNYEIWHILEVSIFSPFESSFSNWRCFSLFCASVECRICINKRIFDWSRQWGIFLSPIATLLSWSEWDKIICATKWMYHHHGVRWWKNGMKFVCILRSSSRQRLYPRTGWQLLGLCCLVCVGLGFAIAVVLALIPLYLNKKTVTPNTGTSTSKCLGVTGMKLSCRSWIIAFFR